MRSSRVLIVGPQDGVATGWVDHIREAGANVTVIADGESAVRHLSVLEPELVIIDLGLSGTLDGFETCRAIRARSATLVVIASPSAGLLDEIVALAVGADQFVCGSTAAEIVVARMRSLLHRANAVHGASNGAGRTLIGGSGSELLDERIVDAELEIDLAAHEVHVAGTEVSLTRIEFELLATLMRHPRRVFTREQLLASVWDEPFDGSHSLDSHLSRLRGKISHAGGERIAHAVRGVGYRLRC